MNIFMLFVSRFGVLCCIVCPIEAVLTGRDTYDSWLGTAEFFLGATSWAAGDLLQAAITDELRDTDSAEQKGERKG